MVAKSKSRSKSINSSELTETKLSINSNINQNEHNLGLAPLGSNRDLVAEMLANKRNGETRKAYTKDLKNFFLIVAGREPTPELVAQFLAMNRFDAIALVLHYKQNLIEQGLAEATINRRLAAIRCLVNYARMVGKCDWTLADVKSEPLQIYRDTTGIKPEVFKQMLVVPNLDTIKGKRDYAILRLLWDNALRRGEVASCDIKDLDVEEKKLWIFGKGRGTQKNYITLSPKTMRAIQDWLATRGEVNQHQPLFIALDNANYGHRLTGMGIRHMVVATAKAAGISKVISPHRIRHSSITAALDATGGDVRQVQKLSRHKNLDTLMVYDDNRRDMQGNISDILSDLV